LYVFIFIHADCISTVGVSTLLFIIIMEESKGDNVITLLDATKTVAMDAIMTQDMPEPVGSSDMGSMPVVNDTSAISRFLSREVLIGSYSWNVGTTPFYRLDPWSLFLTRPSVAEKIKYFSRLRGNLCIRLNISATPFHYGAAMATYRPHPGESSTADPQYNLAVATEAAAYSQNIKIVESQLVGVRFQPCYDHTVSLKCPYVHFRPGFEVAYGNYGIGTFSIIGLTSLQHANGGTNPVSIEIFAWMEDIVLDVPTAIAQGFSLEAAAKKVKNVISAGTYATKVAAEWAPTVMNGIAMLGFSRPLTQDHPSSVRMLPFQLANYDLPDTSERLALSANSEAQLDGVDVGVTTEDPLMVSEIANRNAFIDSAAWSTTDVRGHFLVGSLVTPQQQSVSPYAKPDFSSWQYGNTSHVCQTPVAFAASVFSHWRCDMVYTFTVVASPYHKGRLRVWFDPNPSSVVSPEYNLANSTIINLAEESSAEVRIPWQNVRDAARTEHSFHTNTMTNSAALALRAASVTRSVCNGIVVCEVLNPLTAPVDGAGVTVIVDVRAENFVGYGPRMPRDYEDRSSIVVSDMMATPYTPLSYDVACGDAVASFRQLFKRYSQEYVFQARAQSTAGPGRQVEILLPIFFPPPGQVSTTASALDAGTQAHPVNFTTWTFRSYISQAFALCRGSVRWKVAISLKNATDMPTGVCAVARYHGTRVEFGGVNHRKSYRRSGPTGNNFVDESVTAASLSRTIAGDEGMQMAPFTPNETSTLDVEFPFVSAYRAFNPRSPIVSGDDDRDRMNAVILGDTADTAGTSYFTARVYTAAGEDFNVFYFIHAPAFLAAMPPVV
jgi:hypothetical protein